MGVTQKRQRRTRPNASLIAVFGYQHFYKQPEFPLKLAHLRPQVTFAGGEEYSAKVVGVVSALRAARRAAQYCGW